MKRNAQRKNMKYELVRINKTKQSTFGGKNANISCLEVAFDTIIYQFRFSLQNTD